PKPSKKLVALRTQEPANALPTRCRTVTARVVVVDGQPSSLTCRCAHEAPTALVLVESPILLGGDVVGFPQVQVVRPILLCLTEPPIMCVAPTSSVYFPIDFDCFSFAIPAPLSYGFLRCLRSLQGGSRTHRVDP